MSTMYTTCCLVHTPTSVHPMLSLHLLVCQMVLSKLELLSPILFNVDVDMLRSLLNSLDIGDELKTLPLTIYAMLSICIFFTRQILFEKSSKTYSYINIYK